jgi:hypothetical protein
MRLLTASLILSTKNTVLGFCSINLGGWFLVEGLLLADFSGEKVVKKGERRR